MIDKSNYINYDSCDSEEMKMLQNINMLDFRKKAGQVIDEAFYRKDRFIIKRKNKPVAVLIPVEDYELFITDDSDIEIYSNERIKQFERQDRLNTEEKVFARALLKQK